MTTLDDDRLRVWRSFLEAHASVIDLLEQELRDEEGMPLTWYDVLVHLSEAEERRLRMQDLASAILLSKSGLTRLVDRMEKAGYVRRVPCRDDRRGTWAELTDDGLQALRDAAPTHVRGVLEHFAAHIKDDEVAPLREALGRIVTAAWGGEASH